MKFRFNTVALAASLLMAGPHAWAATDTSGKRVDNGRVDVYPVPSSAEVQPAIAYPLPSGVTREEAASMRSLAAQVPERPAQVDRSLQEINGSNLFVSGKAELTPDARAVLDSMAVGIGAKAKLSSTTRIAIVGHTDNQPLSQATRNVFKDNQGLSEARALAVAAYLKQALNNPAITYSIQGEGESRPLASNATPEGMARNRRVELRVWFEPAVVLPTVAAPRPALVPACSPLVAGQPSVPFRITIDGKPVNASEVPNEADGQRCADVAMEKADIQVRYDSMAISPAMNVWATPNAAVKGKAVEFRAWSNYIPWIRKSEIRIFRAGQKTQEQPLEVMPLGWTAPIRWTVPVGTADDQLFYLVRVYDAQGRFDETSLKATLNKPWPKSTLLR